jgi:anaerobic selenocysteine-containing dehydrogenase
MPETHFRTCNLCEAMCGVAIDYEGDTILAVRGDRDDPFSRGHICPKALGLKDVHEDPDRLREPMRRTAGGWKTIPWDEALDEVAERLTEVQRAHGDNAVAIYQGNPTVHNYGSMLYGQLLVRTLRTKSRFSATSVDQLPHMLAALLMFGHQLLLPIPDIDRTDFMLILGGNPVASNGSLMTAPDVAKRLAAITARGGALVVIDPRRTETAALATQHHFIRPGTDALLLLAMIHTLFEENLTAVGRLAPFTSGIPAIARIAAPFSPEAVEGPVGIAAAVIRELTRGFARAPSAACYGRVGVSTQEFGGLACWLINVLNVLTGNLDRPGGVMFTRPAVDIVGLTARIGQSGSFDKRRSRVRNLPTFGGELPVAVLSEEIETPGPGAIRALLTSAGNPVLSTPNGGRLDRALATLDFMVSIDIYLNETTRHAHVILPPTFALEHDHYDLAFHVLAIRDTAKYSPALFEPPPSARHDWQIFLELETRLKARRGGAARAMAEARGWALGRLGPARLLDVMLRTGPHGDRFRGLLPGSSGLSLKRLRDAPHGIDLGPLEPCLPDRLFTRDRRIALAPDPLVADVERLEARWLRASPSPTADELHLIGRRDLRSNNSWMHNCHRLVKGPARCTLQMHPDDAERRGLAGGQAVVVRSRAGKVEVPLEVSDEVMPGVVSLPHGWGHARPGIAMRVAEAHPGASVNDLTDELLVDTLSGNASLTGVPVTVEGIT